MIPVQQCGSFAGLASNEMILGVTPTRRHDTLLQSYLAIPGLSEAGLRNLMISDLRDFLELGAMRQAADRLLVLRRFLSDYPEARLAMPEPKGLVSKADRIRGCRPKLKASGQARERHAAPCGGGSGCLTVQGALLAAVI